MTGLCWTWSFCYEWNEFDWTSFIQYFRARRAERVALKRETRDSSSPINSLPGALKTWRNSRRDVQFDAARIQTHAKRVLRGEREREREGADCLR